MTDMLMATHTSAASIISSAALATNHAPPLWIESFAQVDPGMQAEVEESLSAFESHMGGMTRSDTMTPSFLYPISGRTAQLGLDDVIDIQTDTYTYADFASIPVAASRLGATP